MTRWTERDPVDGREILVVSIPTNATILGDGRVVSPSGQVIEDLSDVLHLYGPDEAMIDVGGNDGQRR